MKPARMRSARTKSTATKYASTINRPNTTFPMQAKLLERQKEMLHRWQAQDIYRLLLEKRRNADPFIIHDGPPYASGKVHVGIGMNKIIKDMIAKYFWMNGRRAPFVPGWDCHGLPIELAVLKELGEQAKALSTAEIRDRCARTALHYVGEQKHQFQELGIFADWDRPYLTMSPAFEAGALTVLSGMVEEGYVYRALRPVAWCCACKTNLAEAEIDSQIETVFSLWLRFEGDAELVHTCGLTDAVRCSLLVKTFKSWSLPGILAVAARPDFRYSVFTYHDHTTSPCAVVLPEALAEVTFKALGVKKYRKIGVLEGSSLVGMKLAHPLLNRKIPVVLDDSTVADQGTGFQAIAPGHEQKDFAIARNHKLPISRTIDVAGNFTVEAEEFAGRSWTDLKVLTDAMEKKGSLAGMQQDKETVPHCWRCGSQLVVRATEQWFVNLDHQARSETESLRERALREVEVVTWVPEATKQRMHGMLAGRPDWCISRQRLWGVPLPAIICRKCNTHILTAALIARVRDLVGVHGSSVWFEKTATELLPENFTCAECGSAEFDKESSILDVWFESGASWQPMLIADHRLAFPADLYIEGSDQHRGWFQLSLLSAMASRDNAPYRSVLTHGFVLNRKKEQMMRGRGEEVTLAAALEEVPADIIRLYFASVDMASDRPLALSDFKSIEPVYRRIRNTFSFLLGNLSDFTPRQDSIHLDDLEAIDLWALCRLHHLIEEVSLHFGDYLFHVSVARIHKFCADLSSDYLDAAKDRLYCELPSSRIRRSTQTVLHSVLMALTKLLAPVLPYTCDEVWALTPGRSDCASVHLSQWPRADEELLHKKRSRQTEEAYSRWLQLREGIRPALEQLRSAKRIGDSIESMLTLHGGNSIESLLGTGSLNELRDFLVVSEIAIADDSEHLTPLAGFQGLSFGVAKAPFPTCERCRRPDKTCNKDSDNPGLCERCRNVLRSRGKVQLTSDLVAVTPEMRPADLARFLRLRDIRKLALLNEDGKCIAYALHSPSQEVRRTEELQPLADYVTASLDFRDHAALLLGVGEHTDVLFGIGIHHLKYGTPLGGTREFSYLQVRNMIDNMLRLSWGMSVKNAIAELPHGGGKSIIDTCGWDLKVHREFRSEIYRDFGQFTATLFGRYICAEDVGNTNADTDEMLSACRHVMCLSQGVSGSGNPSRFTSLAAWAAVKAGWTFLSATTSFAGLTVALQGAGNVGRNLVALLIQSDPQIARILIADRDPEQIQVIRNILLKRRSEHRLEILSSKDPADQGAASSAYTEREDEMGKDYILYAKCDILVPAAVGNVINPSNVSRLNCKLILPIANNVYSDNDAVAHALFERGIVDVVENNVNWGGAMAAASEALGYDEENVTLACIDAFRRTGQLLREAKNRGCPPWQIIKERARHRVFEEVHPAVEAARRYPFIGDISSGFADWIKRRWLQNMIDQEPEEFPRYAVDRSKAILSDT